MTIGDIDYHEYFNQDTILELKQSFEDIDTSGDGLIATSELYEKLISIGKKVTKSQVRDIIAEVDIDGNGELDWEEYCLLEIKMRRARPRADLINYDNYLTRRMKQQMEQWFALSDRASEDLISVEAVLSILASQDTKGLTDEFVEKILNEVDCHTGAMNFSQFCRFYCVATKQRNLVNYREYLDNDEVERYRLAFLQHASAMIAPPRGRGETTFARPELTRRDLDALINYLGFTVKRQTLSRMFTEFDRDRSDTLDFEEFCAMLLRIRILRKKRQLNPAICSCWNLYYKEKFTVPELMRTGFELGDLIDVGIPVGKLHREGEYTALELREAGFSAAELRKGGVGIHELRTSGYTLTDLRLAGFSAAALSEANRSLQGSISMGDLRILPKICPSAVRSKWSEDFSRPGTYSSDFLKPAKPPPAGWVLPGMRQMTPVVREHTDWKRPMKQRSRLPSLQAADEMLRVTDVENGGDLRPGSRAKTPVVPNLDPLDLGTIPERGWTPQKSQSLASL